MERMDHGGPQGLAVSADGYTLVPSSTELTPGTTSAFAFKVIGKDGKPVKSYTVLHDKELHLIVVRRDLAGYQHVHPTRAASGTWSVPLAVASAGVYKAFANFQPSGQAMPMPMTLAVDLMASGQFTAATLPKPALTATVDGFRVALAGQVVVGGSKLTFTVTKSGKPADLQPYLGPSDTSWRCGSATSPSCTSIQRARPGMSIIPRPGGSSPSLRRCPLRASTGCSSISRPATWCAPPSSPLLRLGGESNRPQCPLITDDGISGTSFERRRTEPGDARLRPHGHHPLSAALAVDPQPRGASRSRL